MPKTAKKWGFESFFEKKCRKNLPVSKMAVILQRFSREISSSGLGRRPLTAETRVRVPVSLPAKPSPNHERGLYLSTEISSSGLGRRPLTAETRVRVPVSLPNKAFIQSRVRAFVLWQCPQFVVVLSISGRLWQGLSMLRLLPQPIFTISCK